MTVKYFITPFASGGQRTVIPDASQVSGAVSYTEGFGPDYSKNLLTDPAAKPVPRLQSNELYYETTLAVQQYQQFGCFRFITTTDNGGTAFPYTFNASAIYDDLMNGPRRFMSNTNANTSLPTGNVDPDDDGRWQRAPLYIFATATGTGNAITINPTLTYQNLLPGDKIEFLATAPNTGPVTLALGTGSPVSVTTPSASGVVPLDGGAFVIGGLYTVAFDGTNYQLFTVSGNAATVPPGTISASGGTVADAGYLACDGTAVSRTAYSQLFAKIGIAWGAGDGVTTFNVPLLARSTLIGSGGNQLSPLVGTAVGDTGGEELHTQTIPELAAHTHGVEVFPTGTGLGSGTVVTGSSGTTGSTGSSTPFNVMQPSAVVFFQIKY